MNKELDYLVITSLGDDIQDKVNDAIKEGYTLRGDIVVTGGSGSLMYYTQVLTKVSVQHIPHEPPYSEHYLLQGVS